LAARRGEGRALVCTRCRDLVRCPDCSAPIARSPGGGRSCPACGAVSDRPPRCERCGPGELVPLAAGAERLASELARSIDAPVVVLEGHAPDLPPAPAVLVMTRGSAMDRAPEGGRVLAVLLPDMDGALRRPTVDAAEDALRLAFRIAGWTVSRTADDRSVAGEDDATVDADARSERRRTDAQVVVETRDPAHHALRALVEWDADTFWQVEEELRRPLRLPPHAVAIRLEVAASFDRASSRVRAHVAPGDDVLGPLVGEGGRAILLVRCHDREATLEALRPLRALTSRSGLELRLDVDPVDLG